MKYVITGQDKSGNRLAATLETKTTRKSKLMSKIDAAFRKKLGVSIHDLENFYVGILNKHTKIK